MISPSAPAPASSSMWYAASWIALRDLLEFVRDRRTLFITLLLPAVTYPILALSTALGLRTATSELEAQQAPTTIQLAVSGPDADAFIDRLRSLMAATPPDGRQGWPTEVALYSAAASAADEAIEDGRADLWVEAGEGMVRELDGVGTATLTIHASTMHPPRRAVREQFAALMKSVADDARRRRVETAGLPASVLAPLRMLFAGESQTGLQAAPQIVTTVAGGVLVLLAVLTMTGAFYPAVDAIAGEKERGTIETLLIAPCSSTGIVLGKFFAVFAITLATLLVNVASIVATSAVAIRALPQAVAFMPLSGTAGAFGIAVMAFVGLAGVAAAASLAVTTAAKSGKEAQNTLTPLILLASALAGTGLLPGMRAESLMAAVPFVGHILVSHAAFGGGGAVSLAMPLALSLLSSLAITWALLQATSFLLTDEDILFRGPDAAGHPLARPRWRPWPTVIEGVVPAVGGLAATWYAQGLMPADLVRAIPLQQAAAVVLPLALMTWWQRVDLRRTFSLRTPSIGGVAGAGLVGGGLFVVGAAALLALTGGRLSPEARDLSTRLVTLVREQPWWVSWALMAVLPAVGEELLFRGWTLAAFAGGLGSRRRVAAAIVAQAVLFSIAHVLPERMPQTFLLGLVLGWITVATGSLWPAVVGHVVHNSMPLAILTVVGPQLNDGMDAVSPSAPVPGGVPAWVVLAAVGCVVTGAMLVWSAVRRRQEVQA